MTWYGAVFRPKIVACLPRVMSNDGVRKRANAEMILFFVITFIRNLGTTAECLKRLNFIKPIQKTQMMQRSLINPKDTIKHNQSS